MKINIRDIPLLLLVFWLLVWNFGITEFQNYYSVDFFAWIIRFLSLLYFFFALNYNSKANKSQILIYIIITIFLLYLCIKSENTRYFDTIFFVLVLRGMDYKRILKIGSYTQFAILIVTIACSLIGIIPNEQVFNAGRVRYNLGFIYCSYSANMLFFATADLIASLPHGKKLNLRKVILLSFINILVFRYTDTKASFWGTILLIFITYTIRKTTFKDDFLKVKAFFVSNFVPISAFISILLGLYYNASNPIYLFLNTISSGRIYMAYVGLKQYGIHLMGSNFEWSTDHTSEYFYVDSSYINILLTMGLLALVLFSLGFARLGYYSVIKLRDKKLAIALLFVAIHCFTDPQLLDLRYNLFIIICFNSFITVNNQVKSRTIRSKLIKRSFYYES